MAAVLLDAGRDKPLEGYLYSVVDNIALPFRQGYKISALLNQDACLWSTPWQWLKKPRPEVEKLKPLHQGSETTKKQGEYSWYFFVFVATVHNSDWAEKFKGDLLWASNGGVHSSWNRGAHIRWSAPMN